LHQTNDLAGAAIGQAGRFHQTATTARKRDYTGIHYVGKREFLQTVDAAIATGQNTPTHS
jgi:hypothetical protein